MRTKSELRRISARARARRLRRWQAAKRSYRTLEEENLHAEAESLQDRLEVLSGEAAAYESTKAEIRRQSAEPEKNEDDPDDEPCCSTPSLGGRNHAATFHAR